MAFVPQAVSTGEYGGNTGEEGPAWPHRGKNGLQGHAAIIERTISSKIHGRLLQVGKAESEWEATLQQVGGSGDKTENCRGDHRTAIGSVKLGNGATMT